MTRGNGHTDQPWGTGLRERAGSWLIASDPGLLRLQTASRTTLTLAVALGVLYLLTKATGEPVTVALLGVVIAMMSAMAVNEPDRRRENITMALLPVPAAAAVSLGALLAPHKVAGDAVFVVVMFAAVYARRFGGRGMALGMVAFMTYFFALFLHATVGQLPWLIGAVVVGTACSFLMRTFVFPDRPARLLHRTLRSLWARVGAVVDATADAVQDGQLSERHRRRLRARANRLNQTALMVENQLEDKVDAAALWPGVDDSELMLRLFDAELAAERLASAGGAVAAAHDVPANIRAELIDSLRLVAATLRGGASTDMLDHAALVTGQRADHPSSRPASWLAVAAMDMVQAAARTRALVAQAASGLAESTPSTEQATTEESDVTSADDADADSPADQQPQSWLDRLRPTTRQAIQVAVASSLAIVAGEFLSPARWYWAVIAAFVVFTGTSSRGETLSKGWERLLGTVLGVPAGVLIATAVDGNTVWSVVLIFVCMFSGFYLIKVAYSLMIFWITTMLALLYGLLGQFSIGVLLLRLEETAVGAAIGVLVATLVLPTSTRSTITDGVRTFLTTLGELVAAANKALLGDTDAARSLTEQARELDQHLQELHTSAKPLTNGVAGITGSGRTRHRLRGLSACDHYARTLARSCDRPPSSLVDPALADAIRSATEEVSDNIATLTDLLDDRHEATVHSTTSLLNDAKNGADGRHSAGELSDEEYRRLRTALQSLRQIDQIVVDLCHSLGATTDDEPTPTAMRTETLG